MTTNTKPRRILPVAVAAAVAATAIAAAAFFVPQALDRSVEGATTTPAGPAVIPALAPADADTFVLAPYSAEWWAKIAAMASPEVRMLEADPVPAGFSVDRIGYSRSPDTGTRDVLRTGPLRLFYLEAPTAEEARKIADWMGSAPGFGNRRIHVVDRVIIVSATWVSSFAAPEKAIAAVPGYRTDETPGKGTYWMNVDQETASLAGQSGEAQVKAASALMHSGLGFSEGTTWLGTSEAGDSWSGRFAAGGVKPENINFDTVRKEVATTDEVLAASKQGNVDYKVLSVTASGALKVSLITAEGQKAPLGTGDKSTFPQVAAPVVSASTEVTGWDAALSGRYGAVENVESRNISANESEMILSLGYARR